MSIDSMYSVSYNTHYSNITKSSSGSSIQSLDLYGALDKASDYLKDAYSTYQNFEDYYFQSDTTEIASNGNQSINNHYLETSEGKAVSLEQFKALSGLSVDAKNKEFLVIRYDRLYRDLNKININIQAAMALFMVVQQVTQIRSKQAAKISGDDAAARESNEQSTKGSTVISGVLKKAVSSYQEFMGNFEETVQEYNYTLYQAKLELISNKYHNWWHSSRNYFAANQSDIDKLKEQSEVNLAYGKATAKMRDWVLAANILYGDASFANGSAQAYKKLIQKDGQNYTETLFQPEKWQVEGHIPVGISSFAHKDESNAHFYRADLELVAKAKKDFNALMQITNFKHMIQVLVMQVLDNAITQIESADYGTSNTSFLEDQYDRVESQISTAQNRLNKTIDKNKELVELANQKEKLRIKLVKLGEGAGEKGIFLRIMNGLKNLSFVGLALSVFLPVSSLIAGMGLAFFGVTQVLSGLVGSTLEKAILDETDQKQDDRHALGKALPDFMRVFKSETQGTKSVQEAIIRLSRALNNISSSSDQDKEIKKRQYLDRIKNIQANPDTLKTEEILDIYYFVLTSSDLNESEKAILREDQAEIEELLNAYDSHQIRKDMILNADEIAFSQVTDKNKEKFLSLSERAQHNMESVSMRLDNLMLELHEISNLDVVSSVYDTEINSQRSASIFLKKGGEQLTVNQAKMADLQDQIRLAQEQFRLNWLVIENIVDSMSALAALVGEKRKRVINHHLEKQLNYRLSLYNEFIGIQQQALELRLSAFNNNIDVDNARFNANVNLITESIKAGLGLMMVVFKKVLFIEPMRVLIEYAKKELLFQLPDLFGNKTYTLKGVKSFNKEAMDTENRYYQQTLGQSNPSTHTAASSAFHFTDTDFSLAYEYHDSEVDRILSEVYKASDEHVFKEDGKKFFFEEWLGNFTEKSRGSGEKLESFQLNLKYFQDQREKIKKHYLNVYAQQVAATIHNQMLKKLVNFESGIQREYEMAKVSEIMERDRERVFAEFSGMMKQFQDEAGMRKQLFNKAFELEKSQLSAMMVGFGVFSKFAFNQHNLLRGNWAQISAYGDMIHGYSSAYFWGSENKLKSFLDEHQSVTNSDLNFETFKNVSEGRMMDQHRDFDSNKNTSQQSLETIREENLKKWNMDLDVNNEAFEFLGWNYRMLNHMEFSKQNLEIRKSLWQIKSQLIPILEEADMLSAKARLNGGAVADVTVSSMVYSALEFEKTIASEQLQAQIDMVKAYNARYMEIQKERLETGMQTLSLVAAPLILRPFGSRLMKRLQTRNRIWPFSASVWKKSKILSGAKNLSYFIFIQKLIEMYRIGFYLSRAQILQKDIQEKLKVDHQQKIAALNRVDLSANTYLDSQAVVQNSQLANYSFEQALYNLKITKGYYVSSDDSYAYVMSLYDQMMKLITQSLLIDFFTQLRSRLQSMTGSNIYDIYGTQAFNRILDAKTKKEAETSVQNAMGTLVSALSYEKSKDSSFWWNRTKIKFKQVLNLSTVPLKGTDYSDARSISSRLSGDAFAADKNDLVFGFDLGSKLNRQEQLTNQMIQKYKKGLRTTQDNDILELLKTDLQYIQVLKDKLSKLEKDFSGASNSAEKMAMLQALLADVEKIHENQRRIKILRYKTDTRIGIASATELFKKEKWFSDFKKHLESSLIKIQLADILSFQQHHKGKLNPDQLKELSEKYKQLNILKGNKPEKLASIVAKEMTYLITKDSNEASAYKSQYVEQMQALMRIRNEVSEKSDTEFDSKYKETLNEIFASALIGTGKDLKHKIKFLEQQLSAGEPKTKKDIAEFILGEGDQKKALVEYALLLKQSAKESFGEDSVRLSKSLFKHALKEKWFEDVADTDEAKVKIKQKLGHSMAAMIVDNKLEGMPDYYTGLTHRLHYHLTHYSSKDDWSVSRLLSDPRLNFRRMQRKSSFHREISKEIEEQAESLQNADASTKTQILHESLALYQSLYLFPEERSYVQESLTLPMQKLKKSIQDNGGKDLLERLERSGAALEPEETLLKDTLGEKEIKKMLGFLKDSTTVNFDVLEKKELKQEELDFFVKHCVDNNLVKQLREAVKSKDFGRRDHQILTKNVLSLAKIFKDRYSINFLEPMIWQNNYISLYRKTPFKTMHRLMEDRPLLFQDETMQDKVIETLWVSLGSELWRGNFKYQGQSLLEDLTAKFSRKLLKADYAFDPKNQHELLIKFLLSSPKQLMNSLDRKSASDVRMMLQKKQDIVKDLYMKLAKEAKSTSPFMDFFKNKIEEIKDKFSKASPLEKLQTIQSCQKSYEEVLKQINNFYSLADFSLKSTDNAYQILQTEIKELNQSCEKLNEVIKDFYPNFSEKKLNLDPFKLHALIHPEASFDRGQQLIDQMIQVLKVANYTVDFYTPEPDQQVGSWSFR